MNRIQVIHAFYLGDGQHELLIRHDKPLDHYTIHVLDEKGRELDKVYEGNETELLINHPYDQQKRLFFRLTMNGEKLDFSHRIVPIEGMYNVRDIGGYLTQSGKRIAWGKVYRGDHLFNLKEEGWPLLEDLAFQSIIDLRSAKEINESPNPYVGQNYTVYCDPNAHIAAFAGMIQDADKGLSHREILENPHSAEGKVNPALAEKQMIEQQRDFVIQRHSQKAFERMLHTLLLETAIPSYQHCRGGKDRTGYGIMLVMALLGVDKELLMEDYLLTKRAREHKNARYREEFEKMAEGNQEIVDYLYTFFDTRASFLEGAFEAMEEKYESIEAYAEDVLNFGPEKRERFKELYLEDEV